MNKHVICTFFVAVFGGVASAQTYDELPVGWTKRVDALYDSFLIPGSNTVPVHVQYAYHTSDVPVAVASSAELAWHRDNYFSSALPAGSVTWVVTMSHGAKPPAGMSTTFANNLGSLTTVVFQGTAGFPAVPFQAGVPAPWTHVLKLTTPFTFVRASGASLVVDILSTAVSGYSNATYMMDASAPSLGQRQRRGGAGQRPRHAAAAQRGAAARPARRAGVPGARAVRDEAWQGELRGSRRRPLPV